MKLQLKHFSGYGFVIAEEIGRNIEETKTIITIRVSGNHERGLSSEYHTEYELFRWLLHHFLSGNDHANRVDYNNITFVQKLEGYLDEPGVLPGQKKEFCDYTFIYNNH